MAVELATLEQGLVNKTRLQVHGMNERARSGEDCGAFEVLTFFERRKPCVGIEACDGTPLGARAPRAGPRCTTNAAELT